MQEAIRKAGVLLEALPYIKSYSNKIFVIKYGGSALIDPDIKRGVLEDIVFMSYVGIRPVLIHGGGPFINEELKKLGKDAEFKNGLRITTKENMDVIDKVLSDLNHKIAAKIEELGGKAASLNTFKKDVIKTKPHKEKGLGFVGEVKEIDKDVIKKAARPRSVPVISPVGAGAQNKFYNVNADDVSSEIAVSLKAAKLVLLTDVKGIMEKKDDESSLIPTLTMKETKCLIDKEIIHGGMIPKVKACMKALGGGVSKTHIIDGRIPHSLLLEIFTDKGIGTEIVTQ